MITNAGTIKATFNLDEDKLFSYERLEAVGPDHMVPIYSVYHVSKNLSTNHSKGWYHLLVLGLIFLSVIALPSGL